MPDLEKTIKCLEYCTGDSLNCGGHDCPYWGFDDSNVSCRTQMELDALALIKEQEETINDLTDTIRQLNQHIKDLSEYMTPYGKVKDIKACEELLKEQEAVEPKKVKGYNPPMYTLYEYECNECKSPMMNKQPFCMGCGRPVKWE